MAGTEDWLAVAQTADVDDVRERILTGYRQGKPFAPYLPTIPLPTRIDRVLDFGCGLGRNFPYLRSIASEVVGFDLPPMIDRCRQTLGRTPVVLTSDWAEISRQRFDLIVATLVLQHLAPAECAARLCDFARLAPATYVLTRVMSDFDTNVIATIAEAERFEVGEGVEVEHDPATNQLRVLGRSTVDELRARRDGGHYELLLRTR